MTPCRCRSIDLDVIRYALCTLGCSVGAGSRLVCTVCADVKAMRWVDTDIGQTGI